jgi:hypothetical protein
LKYGSKSVGSVNVSQGREDVKSIVSVGNDSDTGTWIVAKSQKLINLVRKVVRISEHGNVRGESI